MNDETRPSTLDPAGPAADAVAALWWWMFGLATAVCVLVVVLLLLALRRSRRRDAPTTSPWARRFVLGFGIVMPVLILVPLGVATVLVGRGLNTAGDGEAPLVVEVTGHQFWWEVRYPDLDVVTANEIHMPVGRPVEFRLAAGDVIHSFWVPRLGGKLDMVPGRPNSYVLEAHEPGVFEGLCAEFCGIQHARMHFLVIAQEEADFDAWAASVQEPGRADLSPEAELGREVFAASSCAQCHRVEGVSDGQVGPDLTHLASRRTLAAGVLENNRGNLAGWVLDPQGIKPGVRMPGTDLTGEELSALLDYLEELE